MSISQIESHLHNGARIELPLKNSKFGYKETQLEDYPDTSNQGIRLSEPLT